MAGTKRRDYTPAVSGRNRLVEPSALALDGRARLLPGLPAARQRIDVGVAHALEVVAGEGGAVAAAAVEDEFGGLVGDWEGSARLPVFIALWLCLGQVIQPSHVHFHRLRKTLPLFPIRTQAGDVT